METPDQVNDPPEQSQQQEGANPIEMAPMVAKRGRKARTIENPESVIWHIPRSKTWEDSVRHWFEGDPEAGIPPLKDWSINQINAKTEVDLIQTSKNKRGSQKGRKTTYWRRKVIATEYERLGRQDFINQYSSFLSSQDQLVIEICNQITSDSEF